MTAGALAIFVKTPGYSAVKSRLAADCGSAYAVQWYRHAACAVAAVSRAAALRYGLTIYWAVAEPDAADKWPGLPVIDQGGGGLGERMARVHAELVARHGFGMLIGADAPQLSVELIGQAFNWLDTAPPRLVLGPASDGGFWLFGANVTPPLSTWCAVPYSSPDTARRLQLAMQNLGAWHPLSTLTDVDYSRDLPEVLRALEALPQPAAEQIALAAWMRENDSGQRGGCADRITDALDVGLAKSGMADYATRRASHLALIS